MQVDTPIYNGLVSVYNALKVWIWIGGIMWALMKSANKGMDYVKSIKENDLRHIQMSLNDVNSSNNAIKTGIEELKEASVAASKEQTQAFTEAVRDLKEDLRSLIVARSSSARTRHSD